MHKAVFLDRDGVLNRKASEGEYIYRWEEVELLPGVIDAVRELNQAWFWVILITNQRGVAKGKLREGDLKDIHERMLGKFARQGSHIRAAYYCPHEISAKCECRKPRPGLLLRAAREHSINLPASWMVGDNLSDVEAGKAAGCRTAWLTTLAGEINGPVEPDLIATSLPEAVAQILRLDGADPAA